MKQFFKFMFASMLGTILVMVIIFVIFMGIVTSLVAITEKPTVIVADNTVLHIKLNRPITDRAPKDPFSFYDMASKDFVKPLGMNDILRNIKHAAGDDKIKGVYLDQSIQVSLEQHKSYIL